MLVDNTEHRIIHSRYEVKHSEIPVTICLTGSSEPKEIFVVRLHIKHLLGIPQSYLLQLLVNVVTEISSLYS